MPIAVFVVLCAEIALLIKLGQTLGGGVVLAEILLTGALGYVVLRFAGRTILRSTDLIELLAHPTSRLRLPGWRPVLGGILLLMPGMITDVIGLGLALWHVGARRGGAHRSRSPQDPNVIDVAFRVHDDRSPQ